MSSAKKSRRLSLSVTPEPNPSIIQPRDAARDPTASQSLLSPSQRSSVGSGSRRNSNDQKAHRGSSGHNRSLSQPKAGPPGLLVKTLSKRFNPDEHFLSDDESEELRDALSSALSSDGEGESEKGLAGGQDTDKLIRPSMVGAIDLIYNNAPSPFSIEIVPALERRQSVVTRFHLVRRHSFTDLNAAAFTERHEPFNEAGWYYLAMKTKAHERVRRAFWAWTIWMQARRIAKFRYRTSCSKIRRYRNKFIGVKMKEWALRARLPTENRNERQGRRSIQGEIHLSRGPRTLQEIKSFAKKLESLQIEMPLMMQMKIWQSSIPILQSFIETYSREIGPSNTITIQARQRLALIRSKISSGSGDIDLPQPGQRRFSLQMHKQPA